MIKKSNSRTNINNNQTQPTSYRPNFLTSCPKLLFSFLFMFVLSFSSVFGTIWIEDFEDQPISNNATVFDNGITSWNSSIISAGFTTHGVQNVFGTKAFKLMNGRMLFKTGYINASNASGDVDVSLNMIVLSGEKDKFDADDLFDVYVRSLGGLRTIALSLKLSDFDKTELIDNANILNFKTNLDVFSIEIETQANEGIKEVLAFDEIKAEWLEIGETPVEVSVNTSTFNSFNTSVNNNINVTTFLNNTLIVNVGGEDDNFDGFFGLNQNQNICPLDSGSSDKDFYTLMIIVSIVLFIFAFWLDNAFIGVVSSMLILYIALITTPCAVLISLLLAFLGVVGIFLSLTQLSLTKT